MIKCCFYIIPLLLFIYSLIIYKKNEPPSKKYFILVSSFYFYLTILMFIVILSIKPFELGIFIFCLFMILFSIMNIIANIFYINKIKNLKYIKLNIIISGFFISSFLFLSTDKIEWGPTKKLEDEDSVFYVEEIFCNKDDIECIKEVQKNK